VRNVREGRDGKVDQARVGGRGKEGRAGRGHTRIFRFVLVLTPLHVS